MTTETLTDTSCYHCGTPVAEQGYQLEEKSFCCVGCKNVYQFLLSNNLRSYYVYNDAPGQTQAQPMQHFEYLDEPNIIANLIDYTDAKITTVTFYIPAIHCSSCIWLLEHLHKLNSAVICSKVDFIKKQVSISFRHQQLPLRKLVQLIASTGYEPLINVRDVVKEQQNTNNRILIKRIVIAGFMFFFGRGITPIITYGITAGIFQVFSDTWISLCFIPGNY